MCVLLLSGALLAAMVGSSQGGRDATMSVVFRDRDGSPTAVARSVSSFGHAILKQVAARGGNVCVSPISLWFPFSLVYQGSSGESRRQLASVLRPAEYRDTLLGAREAMAVMNRRESGLNLALQNGMWFRPDMAPASNFRALATGPFASRVFQVPASEASSAINKWVAEVTAGKIPELIRDLSATEVMVLANAAYLKAEWAQPFRKESTTPRPFFVDGKRQIEVPTMGATLMLRTVPHPDLLIAAIPYKSGSGWLVLAMPKAGHDLSDLWGRDLAALCASATSAPPQECIVVLPKWKSKSDLNLKSSLIALGVTAPWAYRREFAGIHPEMFVSQAVHKCVIEVDEKGTEAAAATAIIMGTLGGSSERKLPPILTFNRPFYYAVIERTTGLPLFAGVLTDPTR